MPEYVTIGYEFAGRMPIPISVRRSSVIEDKSVVIPRITRVYEIFCGDVKFEKRDPLLKDIINKTFILDGRDPDAQRILKRHVGVYSRPSGNVYVDVNWLNIPSLVEHEIIHLMGETTIRSLPFPRRLVNHHAVAANIATTLLDADDVLGHHNLGKADEADFKRLKLYKLLPIEFQEGILDFQKTCFRIGNYARENEDGYNLLYALSR